MNQNRIAVVGAGLSGLTCARELRRKGVSVWVFDKARGSGGRCSTRRRGETAFDHGAQYFTVRDSEFEREVAEWERAGVVAEWEGAIVALRRGTTAPTSPTRRLVGLPGMSTICRQLAARAEVTTSFHLDRVERVDGRFALFARGTECAQDFDALVLALPAPQVPRLASHLASGLAARAREVEFAPCWAVMLELEARVEASFDGAFVEDSPLSWVARNSSKPQRAQRETWVLHASPSWSRDHLRTDPAEVGAELTSSFRQALGADLPRVAATNVHRWAHALPLDPLSERCLFDGDSRIGACGDWCAGPRVEGAYLSGRAMADQLIESLTASHGR